jgi:NADH-quinone oxidoreductase subunit G/[NiFe] hydrogenase diaphorase moiety small subunit
MPPALSQLKDILKDKSKEAVVFMAPAVRAGIGEFLGRTDYANLARRSATALRQLGFARVFDMSFSADITTLEETAELMTRLRDGGTLPQFTSCCPGWAKMRETKRPELAAHMSTTKSPQAIFGSALRHFYRPEEGREAFIVSLVPCLLKKPESERPDLWAVPGRRDIDSVFTTKDFFDMAEEAGISIEQCEEGRFDDLAPESGSGVIYGSTGGVISAILRTLLTAATGGFDQADLAPLRGQENIKTVSLTIGSTEPVPEILRNRFTDFSFLNGRTIKAATAHSIPAIEKIVQSVAEGGEFAGFDMIEFMMCPGGCVGGAGQKRPEGADTAKARAGVLAAADRESLVKSPLSNPALLDFYRSYLPDGPGGELAHKLFHKHG